MNRQSSQNLKTWKFSARGRYVFVLFVIFSVSLSFLGVLKPYSVGYSQSASVPVLQPMSLTVIASNGTQIVLDSTDIASLPSYRAAGGYENSVGTLVGPDNYTGVPLVTLLNLVGGINSYDSVELNATDGYTFALTYNQVNGWNFTTYDPVTGNPVQSSQPLTPMLAYYKDDVNLTSDQGPLMLAIVGPEGLLTEGKIWVKWVTTLEVIGEPEHDVDIVNFACSKTVVGQGFGANLTVTLQNEGNYRETFNVTIYNTTLFAFQNVTLTSGNSANTTFTWNTTSVAYGNYTIWANVTLLPGEKNTANNNSTSRWIIVTIPGDVNGDFKVGLADLVILAQAYGSKPGDPKWNPNADIDGKGVVGLTDLVILANHYGQHYP